MAKARKAVDGAKEFTDLGFVVNRLHCATDGTFSCADDISCGAPLLALPLDRCWTKQAVRSECPEIAMLLQESPSAALLEADSTWIALHMIHVMHRGGNSARRLQLKVLPEVGRADAGVPLLSCDAIVLASFQGSRWKEEAEKRRVQLLEDYETLRNRFGKSMDIDKSEYFWAQQIIDQFGIQFMGDDGFPFTVVVPGLNLIKPDENTTPAYAGGARIEIAAERPTFVLYAERDYTSKEEYKLLHGGLACSTGCRLMRCGKPLSNSQCESVELQATLTVDMMPRQKHAVASVLEGAAALFTDASPPAPVAGECVTPDVLDGRSPVSMDDKASKPTLSFTVRFSSTCLVPSPRALAVLGTVMTYDSNHQGELSSKEGDTENVFGIAQCQKRALEFLQKLANEALLSYPDSIAANSLGSTVIAAEKKLLQATLIEIETLLRNCSLEGMEVSPAPSSASEVMNDLRSGHFKAGSSLSKVIDMLRNSSALCGEIAASFQTRPPKLPGEALTCELDVLRSRLGRCPLGDPTQLQRMPVLESADEVAQVFKEAAATFQNAAMEACKWTHAVRPEPMDSAQRSSAASALVKVAACQMKGLDFAGAMESLRKSLALSTSSDALKFAGDCAVACAAPAAMMQDIDWDVHKSAMNLLRQKLKDLGYTKPGAHWSYPARLPVTMRFADQSELPQGELEDALRLFMMHSTVAMGRVAEVLGKKVTSMLLECGVLSCYNAVNAEILGPSDAMKLVSKKPALPLTVFSNVMLWPVEETVLVAFDFDQLTIDKDKFDPVPCLSQDSQALMRGAPRSKVASVLHIQCGNGAHGLLALRHYADKVVFLDSNPRALGFVRFSVHLNGFGNRATFVTGHLENGLPSQLKQDSFDVILACPTCFPAPSGVVWNAGSAFCGGGSDGLKSLGIVIKSSVSLLKNAGRFVSACTLPNVDNFTSRLKSWLENTCVSAVVLQGERMTISKYANLATAGSSVASSIAFLNGLKAEGVESMSESVIMLQKAAEGGSAALIDLRDEHLGLWSDVDYVTSELRSSLDQRQLLETNMENGSDAQLYDLDWDAGDDEIIPAGLQGALVASTKKDKIASCWSALSDSRGQNGRLASLIQPKREKEFELQFPIADGATWRDATFTQVLGFPLPCLVDQLWRKVEIPLGTHFPPNANAPEGLTRIPPSSFNMAMVELEGCASTPEIAKEAMQCLDCFDVLTYESLGISEEGEPLPSILRKRHFGGWRKKLKDGEMPPDMLERYDTFVLALAERSGEEEWVLPHTMRQFLTYISAYVEKHNVAKRVVVLTSGATGPTFPDGPMQDMVHSAAPLRGLLRCARIEVPELPILAIDTDQMSASGDAEVLADQISRELEAYTPLEGLQDCTPEQFSEAVYRTHREVSWRKGDRYYPGWVVSARNPIHLSSDLGHCRMPADEVAFITGGTGGLGVVTAEAMVEAGLRCVILSSRGGKLYEGQGLEERVAKMERLGATIVLDKCDTGSEESVKDALSRARKYGKLKHILHAAGVFRVDVKECFAPKVKAAWWLHKYTLDDKPDTFVCYASMTEFIGTAQMSAYAQANTYMEELCRHRHAMGFSGCAIMFPEVNGAGMATATNTTGQWDTASIGVDHTKQALKQVIAGTAPIGPVIGILTFGFLFPRPPISAIQHAPLYARRNPAWADIPNLEGLLGPKAFKQIKGLMRSMDDYLPSMTGN